MPHSAIQFYSELSPEVGNEMWSSVFRGFCRRSRGSLINIQGVALCESISILALSYSADCIETKHNKQGHAYQIKLSFSQFTLLMSGL